MNAEPAPPPGFVHLDVCDAHAVVVHSESDALRGILERSTLYDYAARHPLGQPLAGRGVAYATPLRDDGGRVVVRHNRHGGLFARVTRDLFLPPTRAPRELDTTQRLRAAGVATPEFVAYVIYRAGPVFRRSDVATREVPNASDLSTAIMSRGDAHRRRALAATAELLARLSAAGARHHDLNIKNVLLTERDGKPEALVLDVDRVEFFDDGTRPIEQNLARLLRSARKWRKRYGAFVTEAELSELSERARALTTSSTGRPSTRA